MSQQCHSGFGTLTGMQSGSGDRVSRQVMILAALVRGVTTLGLGLVAASCSSKPAASPAGPPGAAVPTVTAPPASAPAKTAALASSAPTPIPKPAALPPPIAVIGLSETNVEALFGPPASRATEGAGHIWRYISGDCSVTLFFFLDVDRADSYAKDQNTPGSDFYALDQKVTGSGGNDAAVQRCLRRIADAKPHQS
jgi:hypothetical protein